MQTLRAHRGAAAPALLALLPMLAVVLLAPDSKAQPAESAAAASPDGADLVSRSFTATIGDAPMTYTATTGFMPIAVKEGEPAAEVFYIAYTKDQAASPDQPPRPITFTFNGGPGSSSVWLHMGALGPRRVVFGDDGEPLPPPAKLADNEHSWLAFTDLVFIDPVTTGYSRPLEDQNAKQFHGLDEDIRAVGEFIRLYTTRNNRWLSDKYLCGESYGTTRAGGLANYLQDQYGMYLNGIVLVSPVLDFSTLRWATNNDKPFPLYFPTYAATAWKHKALKEPWQSRTLEEVIAAAEAFASGPYLHALERGDRMSTDDQRAIAEQYAALSGLDVEFVLDHDLKVSQPAFCKELLRDRGVTVGRLDSRYTGIDRTDAGDSTSYDPSYSVILGPYSAAVNHYLSAELGFTAEKARDRAYEILTGKVQPWNMGATNSYATVAENLRQAMTKNPSLRVLVCNGYYDLATPHYASDYTLAQMHLDPSLRGNITVTRYPSGHMMYVRMDDLIKLTKDAAAFYAGGNE